MRHGVLSTESLPVLFTMRLRVFVKEPARYRIQMCIRDRYRGMGSIDFFAVARSVLLVGRIEGEPDLRAVVQIKNNLAAFGHSKAFRLTETGFEWIGDYEITADEVLGGIAPKINKLEQAKKMLRELAETSTSVQSSEIFDMAEEMCIRDRRLLFAGFGIE